MAFIRRGAGGSWGSSCYGFALLVSLHYCHHVSIDPGEGGIALGWEGQGDTEWRDLGGSRPQSKGRKEVDGTWLSLSQNSGPIVQDE